MKKSINLLPTAYCKQRMLRRRAMQWSTATFVVFLGIWAARWYELREYYALSQQLEAVARESRPAQTMLKQITEMRGRLEDLTQQEKVAMELQQQRHVLTLLGTIGQATQRTGGRLRVTKFETVDFQSSGRDNPNRMNESQSGSLTLVGASLDSASVAELHDALVDSGLFRDVKLIKSNEQEESGLAMYDYEVRCDL